MAYVIPITGLTGERGDRGPVVLIVILTRENLVRMNLADPFDLQLRNYLPDSLKSSRMDQLDLIIAYEENENALMELRGYAEAGNLKAIIQWVERGRRHQPGDATPPIRLPRKQESN